MTSTGVQRSATTDAADRIVGQLLDGELAWARTPLAVRAAMLGRFGDLVAENAEEWVRDLLGDQAAPRRLAPRR